MCAALDFPSNIVRPPSWFSINETIYCVFIYDEALLYPDRDFHRQVPPFG
jgi:hypothetical protein